MLRGFANLSSAVSSLFPLKLNVTHPRFEQIEKAVIRACKKDADLMFPAVVGTGNAQMLQGHTYDIKCCAVFANDTRLVSGSRDSSLEVWDLSIGPELHTLLGIATG